MKLGKSVLVSIFACVGLMGCFGKLEGKKAKFLQPLPPGEETEPEPASGPPQGASLGGACTTDDDCSHLPGGFCAANSGSGVCLATCDGTCPTGSFCTRLADRGFCFAECDLSASSCGSGETCAAVEGMNPGERGMVCIP